MSFPAELAHGLEPSRTCQECRGRFLSDEEEALCPECAPVAPCQCPRCEPLVRLVSHCQDFAQYAPLAEERRDYRRAGAEYAAELAAMHQAKGVLR